MAETGLRTAKLHQLTILLGVGMPVGQALGIGIASMGKLCPDRAQEIGPAFVLVDGLLRQLVAVVMKHIEAVF